MENILVGASLTDSSKDALGNDIIDPRGSKTFNADGSGYALVPDSDSLDLTTAASWVLKADVSGESDENKGYLAQWSSSDGQRSWIAFKSSGAGGADRIKFNLQRLAAALHTKPRLKA